MLDFKKSYGLFCYHNKNIKWSLFWCSFRWCYKNNTDILTVYIQLMTLLNEWSMFLSRLFLKIPPAFTSFGSPQTNISNKSKKRNCYILPGHNLGTATFMVRTFFWILTRIFLLLVYLETWCWYILMMKL